MLSKRDLRCMGKITNWTNLWGGCPFYWDFKREKLLISTSTFGIVKWFLTVFYTLMYILYAILRCVFSIHFNRPIVEYNLCFLILSVALVPVVAFVMFFSKDQDIIIAVNSAIRLSNWFYEEYKDKEPKVKPKLVVWVSRLILALKHFMRFYGLVAGILSLVIPYETLMPASIIPENRRSIYIVITQSVVVTWLIFACGGAISSWATIVFVMSMAYLQAQDQGNLNMKTFWTKPKLRTPHHTGKLARSLHIMFRLVENVLRSFLMPLIMIATRSVQVCNYVLIRHRQDVPLMYFVLSIAYSISLTLFMFLLLHCAAQINSFSTKLVKTWKNCPTKTAHEKKVWKKFRASVKPLTVQVGDYYTIKNKTVLTQGSTLIRGTMRILLALKKRRR